MLASSDQRNCHRRVLAEDIWVTVNKASPSGNQRNARARVCIRHAQGQDEGGVRARPVTSHLRMYLNVLGHEAKPEHIRFLRHGNREGATASARPPCRACDSCASSHTSRTICKRCDQTAPPRVVAAGSARSRSRPPRTPLAHRARRSSACPCHRGPRSSDNALDRCARSR